MKKDKPSSGFVEPNRSGWRFARRFGSVAAPLFALYSFPYAENGVSEAWFKAYLGAYARAVGASLSLLESNISVSEQLIYGRMTLQIVKTCDAMEMNILFCAAVAALPAPAGRRLAVIGTGLVILVAVNVLRICSLYYVGVYFPSAFESAHLEVWPLALVLVTATLFLTTASWVMDDSVAALP